MNFLYQIGQTVYMKSDDKQDELLIRARKEMIGGSKSYTLGFNGAYFEQYEEELSPERNELKALNIPTNDSNCRSTD
jgi:hypothetical protein